MGGWLPLAGLMDVKLACFLAAGLV
jgi:hypothetical protein